MITGGAGFVGANVVRALVGRGADVTVLDSGVAAGFGYLEGIGVQLIEGDVRDESAVRRALDACSAIVHLAARTSVPDSIAHPREDFAVNVSGSVNLLEAAREVGVQRIVFASSNAVIGGHPPPSHERLVARPVSPYGAAKAAVEAYLGAYHRAYGQEGVALRMANVYGPWSAHKGSVVAAFVKAYLRGEPLVIRGTGEQTRDFVHVDDVTAMVLACLDAPAGLVSGEVFTVGTGTETSVAELAQQLAEVGGAPAVLQYQDAGPGDVPRNVSDTSKARDVLGYAPRTDLRAGLASTLEWFRGNWRV